MAREKVSQQQRSHFRSTHMSENIISAIGCLIKNVCTLFWKAAVPLKALATELLIPAARAGLQFAEQVLGTQLLQASRDHWKPNSLRHLFSKTPWGNSAGLVYRIGEQQTVTPLLPVVILASCVLLSALTPRVLDNY